MEVLQLGASFQQSLFIWDCMTYGHNVHTLDNRPENYGHKISKESINISTTDVDTIRGIITSQDYIISAYGSDISMLTLIDLGDSPLLKALRSLCLKTSARRLFRKIWGSKQPRLITQKDYQDGIRLDSDIVVVKPNLSSGSKGVTVIPVHSLDMNLVNDVAAISLDAEAIIEEYMPNDGNKYFCEGIKCKNDLMIVFGLSTSSNSNLLWDGSILFTESNCYDFTGLDYVCIRNQLEEKILELLSTLEVSSIQFLSFNIDFFINSNNIVLIEFAPRPGGNFLPLYLEYVYNINYAETVLQSTLADGIIVAGSTHFMRVSSKQALRINISNSISALNASHSLLVFPLPEMPASSNQLVVSNV